MSSPRIARALLPVGQALGQMAEMSWHQDMATAEAERQDNLARLRHTQDLEMEGRREAHDVSMESSRVQANKDQSVVEHDYRSKEIEGNQAFQTKMAGREESLTRERWTREDRSAVEMQGARDINQLDERILKLTDTLGEAEMKGEVMDPAGSQRIQQEIAGLRDQRTQARQALIFRLADMGDPRYKKVAPPASAAGAPGAAGAPVAAQAADPTAIAPPPPSPRDKRDARRKDRTLLPGGSPAPGAAQAAPPSDPAMRTLLKTGSTAFHGQEDDDAAIAQAFKEANLNRHRVAVPERLIAEVKRMSATSRRRYGLDELLANY